MLVITILTLVDSAYVGMGSQQKIITIFLIKQGGECALFISLTLLQGAIVQVCVYVSVCVWEGRLWKY